MGHEGTGKINTRVERVFKSKKMNNVQKKENRMQAIFETIFDVVYLSGVILLGVIMLKESGGRRQYKLYGAMAVVLGLGDSFHLIPRAVALCTTGLEDYTAALGIGKLITSVTMTIFYVMLYYVWRERYEIKGRERLTRAVWALAICRMILCLMPQNRWVSPEAPLAWGIYRNIPFAVLGAVIVVLFYKSAREKQDRAFRFLWLTVVLSFGFYIPVVLFADAFPLVGMPMIPKTCAYVWTVLIGFRAMKGEKEI